MRANRRTTLAGRDDGAVVTDELMGKLTGGLSGEVPDKAALRAEVLASRRARPAEAIAQARAAVCELVLGHCRQLLPATAAPRVAAYLPLHTEPGSAALLAGLQGHGAEVIVPVRLPDNDLDWQRCCLPAGPGSPAPAQARPELGPALGPLLGPEAITGCALVLVPALAVGRDGARLGRGAGCYDRALRRVAPAVPIVALLFDGELRAAVPADPWDVPMTAAALPSGWVELPMR